MSEEKNNVYKKLAKARNEIKIKGKSGKNAFSGFEYYELEDFLGEVKKVEEDMGLTSVFSLDKEKATLLILDSDNPESKVEFSMPFEMAIVKGCSPIQNIGATMTYCRRYLFLNAYNIATPDELDSTVGEKKTTSGKYPFDCDPRNGVKFSNYSVDKLTRVISQMEESKKPEYEEYLIEACKIKNSKIAEAEKMEEGKKSYPKDKIGVKSSGGVEDIFDACFSSMKPKNDSLEIF